jgi:hypothetical protein
MVNAWNCQSGIGSEFKESQELSKDRSERPRRRSAKGNPMGYFDHFAVHGDSRQRGARS